MNACGVTTCEKPRRTKGFCDSHYRRWKKYGDPEHPDQSTRAIVATQAAKVAADRISAKERLEDIEWMAETGESFVGAAARIGVTPKALEKFLSRWGRLDLRRTLAARNPAPVYEPDLIERRVAAWHASRKATAA